MNRRVFSTVIGMMGLSICLMTLTARAENYEAVVKYGGKLVKAANGTGLHEVFQAMAMPNGPVMMLAIPNNDESKPAYDPNKKVEGLFADFKAGDLIDLTFAQSKIHSAAPLIQTARAYTPQPGEDDPHAFKFEEAFDHKVGEQTISAITLSKYLQKTNYLVPTHNDGGDLVADDTIKGIAAHLTPGELVYAVTVGRGDNQTVKLLAPWKNHFTGKFVQFDKSEAVDDNNDTGPAVEITGPDGKQITALIPGTIQGKRWVPDQTIFGPARGLKAGADVDYITADSGDKRTWLVSIARAKPAEHSRVSQNGG